ncbi:MAG: hypothetical protein E7380_05115 [Clostridiales bacterium]|nr:hypothetical protein [Clostridiales bacterium]
MKRLHLICNAHIDPLWQWTWDEGIAAAIATFKSAADLAEEFDYIFCHGESLLYEAIEEHAPDLFARIVRLVKEGKWKITGGWYLQPDCLMPCGEALVRQISVGKKYFQEKFGVEPTVATNYDSFGHSVGLVQILVKNGYEGYMVCRPNQWQFSYPSKFFYWKSPDGSKIATTQSLSYSCALGKAVEKIESEVYGGAVGMLGSAKEDTKIALEDVDYVLWGVGNHGGGPSRKDLRDIKNLQIAGVEHFHSTHEKLFADGIKICGEIEKSLVTCMPGCYSSMARVKQAYRTTENLFFGTEKMLALSSLSGMPIKTEEWEKAEKRILLAQFHDILPGSGIEECEQEGIELLAASAKELKDYRTRAFLRFVMDEPSAGEGEFPIFVFNYMPYEVQTLVEVEFILPDQNWSKEVFKKARIYDETGKELLCQQIKESSTLALDWRKRLVFEGLLKPMGITRFTVKTEDVKTKAKARKAGDLETLLQGTPLQKPVGFFLYDDTADPWGMSQEELKGMGKNPVAFREMQEEESKAFCKVTEGLSPVHIIEDGDVVTVAETLSTAGHTNAVAQYKVYKNHPFVDLKLTVEFADKNKMARVRIPLPDDMAGGKAVGDGPFVYEEKPCFGELSFQKWLGVEKNGEVFAVLNDGVYAGTVEEDCLCLTLLRGAGYCFHPITPDRDLYPQDRYLPRIENGRYTYNLRIVRGDVCSVYKQAELFNQLPYAVNVFPTGGAKKELACLRLDGDVVLTTMKVGEKGGYIFRVFNPAKEEKPFVLSVSGKQADGVARAGEVVTLSYKDGVWKVFHDEMPV